MSEQRSDPSGNTEMFKAFVSRTEPEAEASRTPVALIAAIAVVVVVAVAVVGWLALS